jgi:ABC-type amino acid transport system permease subunit
MKPQAREISMPWESALVAAIVAASMLAYVAHDDLGLTRQEIRTPSLIAAGIIGLLLATDYFGKKLRKPE